MIKRFIIEGLFGYKKVDIDFEDPIKIIVGENGTGKTTIMNILYYTLVKDNEQFKKLKNYDFEKISIELNDTVVTFSREDINDFYKVVMPMELRRMNNYIGVKKMETIIAKIKDGNHLSDIEEYQEIQVGMFNINRLNIQIKEYIRRMENCDNIINIKAAIDAAIDAEIIYLPTYRRIEEEFADLEGIGNRAKREVERVAGAIHFGMEDVKNLIDGILRQIVEGYKEGYSEILSGNVKDIISNKSISNEKILDLDKVLSVIERIDDNVVSKELKEAFERALTNVDITMLEEKGYGHFFNQLCAIYDMQQEKEKKIGDFCNICNDYLVNKKMEYIARDNVVKIFGVDSNGKKLGTIELDKLSSGEKQIVALFARLYLAEEKEYIILFDEPELSLSIEWQEKLIPNILASDKCKMLFAVTHSPFIFNNECKRNVTSIDMYLN